MGRSEKGGATCRVSKKLTSPPPPHPPPLPFLHSVAQFVNLGTIHLTYGWRISLALAAVPAFFLTLSALALPDSPSSLASRGKPDAARAVLVRLRGTPNVDAEMDDILDAVKATAAVRGGGRALFTRRYRPELTVALLVPLFQQMSGVNMLMFYGPIILSSVGFSASASLLCTCVIGAINVAATLVSVALVDRVGRKPLFIQGGVQMVVAHVALAGLLAAYFKDGAPLPRPVGLAMIGMICVFVSAFAWSWGPLGWLVPAELQPLHTRPLAQSINVSVNMALTALIGQTLLSMMCTFKAYVFLFFAGWMVVATAWVALFLPETKGVPCEEVAGLWADHWFWARFVRAGVADDGDSVKKAVAA